MNQEKIHTRAKSSVNESTLSDNQHRRLGLDRISHTNRRVKNSNFESNIEKVTSSMTDDPVLSSILADTAKTTLQEQISAGDRGHMISASPSSMVAGDSAAIMASKSDPMDLFEGSAQKWASLAFPRKS